MKARKPVKSRKLSVWLWAAVVAGVIISFGAAGCRSTGASGGSDNCGSGCTGH